MICSNCGTQIPDTSNFCLKCGHSQKVETEFNEPKWETCEISVEENISPLDFMLLFNTERFVAKAIGPKGPYIAATTEFHRGLRVIGSKKSDQLLNEIITKLVEDGWESVGRGHFFYDYRFRRRVR